MERDPWGIFLSIAINWIVGLSPAVVLRFAVIRRPLGRRASTVTAIVIGAALVVVVSALGHAEGITPNMAPVVIMAFLSHAILRIGGAKETGSADNSSGAARQDVQP